MKLTFHLFKLLVSEVRKLVEEVKQHQPMQFDESEMGPDGQGKIRCIGGWAVKKALDKAKNNVENQ